MTSSCPSLPVLERALLNELPRASADARHIAGCPKCAEALDSLRLDTEQYRSGVSARRLRALIDAKIPRSAPGNPWLWLNRLAAPLGAAAAFALLWILPSADPGLHAKGEGTLQIQMQSPRGRVGAWAGEAFPPGTPIQLVWTTPKPGYLAVAAEDVTGEIRSWVPEEGSDAQAVPAGTHPLGGSLTFDAPFRGSVWVLSSDKPFVIGPWIRNLRGGNAPPRIRVLRLDVPRSP